jgi:enoyl-CoA hydratase
MSDDVVLLEVADGIATVTLNRPQAMNALNRALRQRLAAVMRAVNADDNVRAVILTGAGERAFTAGLDLKELGSEAGALGSANATDPAANPVKAIELCCKPVIGAINGVAITGGFEVALACDVLVASSNARFADTHARVGIVPGWGLSQKLSRMIGISRAKELAFTGNFLDAATAHSWGLVNHVVAPDELLRLARRLASDMAGIDPGFLATYKRLIDDGFVMSFGEGLALEAERSSAANSAVAPEEVEARRAAVQQRGRQNSAPQG